MGSTTTTTVPSTNNKISAVGGASYTYDSAGNITADGTNTYVWSAAGLLKESKVGGTTMGAYTYSASNQRTKKVAGGNTTQYVYGAGGLLYGEYDNTGALIKEYVYLNGEPLAQISAGSPEVLVYLHPDHLGTPRYGTNTGGTQVWTWASDAYGVGAPSGSATVNLRMPGQYYDSESGLFYNWNRYYNPVIGRYVSVDPIGLAGGMNTFLYGAASPVMYSDPEGLKMCYPDWPDTSTGRDCRAFYPDDNICPIGVPECASDLPEEQRQIDPKDLTRDINEGNPGCVVSCACQAITCGLADGPVLFMADVACSTVLYEICYQSCIAQDKELNR